MGWTPNGIQPFHCSLESVFLLFAVKRFTLSANVSHILAFLKYGLIRIALYPPKATFQKHPNTGQTVTFKH